MFTTTILLSEQAKKMSEEILTIIRDNSKISAKGISEIIGKTSRTVERKIQKFKKEGILKHIGSTKSGHWEIKDGRK